MKKFFPLVVFILVFSAILAGHVGYKTFVSQGTNDIAEETKFYENLFLRANFKTIDNKTVEMTKLSAPVVIFNFWASWCLPCLEEMPSMLELKKKFSEDQLQIVAINTDVDDQMANVKKVVNDIDLKNEFIIVPDKNANITNQFKISAIPVTIIFQRGKVVHLSNGPMDFASEEMSLKMKEWVKI